MYPEVQRKAQAEIDRFIESDRLPTLADQPSLPYVDALVKEVLRWNPVTPLGKLSVFRSRGFPFVPREANFGKPTRNSAHRYRKRRLRGVFHSQGILGNREYLVSETQKGEFLVEVLNLSLPPVIEFDRTGKFCTIRMPTPIRWNSILNGFWEIVLSRSLV